MMDDVEVLSMQTDDAGCNPTDLPSPVGVHASVYSPSLKSLITCGGFIYPRLSSSCLVQSKNGSNSSNQISIPPMKSARAYFAMVLIRDHLISIGGLGESGNRDTMETIQFNVTNEWIEQSMPFSVVLHCAVTLDDNIFVIGGSGVNGVSLNF